MSDTCLLTAVEPKRSGVFVVCSGRLIGEAFQCLIKSSTLDIVGRSSTLANVLTDVDAGPRPDLIIIIFESDQEAEGAYSVLSAVRARHPGINIMILTRSLKLSVLRVAVRTGIDAVLTTEISATVLQHAVELVLLGQRLLPAEMAQLLEGPQAAPMLTPGSVGADPAPGVPSSMQKRPTALSQREREILQWLVSGCSNKLIARELNITEATVKVHVKALLRKTQMTNRTQAAIWALNNGLHLDRTEQEAESFISEVVAPDRPGAVAIDISRPMGNLLTAPATRRPGPAGC
jgi:two-component system, NarL family, nitrate/nitrite response regulator NarL